MTETIHRIGDNVEVAENEDGQPVLRNTNTGAEVRISDLVEADEFAARSITTESINNTVHLLTTDADDINEAIQEHGSNTEYVVHNPGEPIHVPNTIRIVENQGEEPIHDVVLRGEGWPLLVKQDEAVDVIRTAFEPRDGADVDRDFRENILVEGFRIDGNWTNIPAENEQKGIRLQNVKGGTVRDCEVFECERMGVEVQISKNVVIENCYFHDMDDDGVSITDTRKGDWEPEVEDALAITENVVIRDCFAWDNTDTGFEIDDGPSDVHFVDCYSWNNGFYNYDMHAHTSDKQPTNFRFTRCFSMNHGDSAQQPAGFAIQAYTGEDGDEGVVGNRCVLEDCVSVDDDVGIRVDQSGILHNISIRGFYCEPSVDGAVGVLIRKGHDDEPSADLTVEDVHMNGGAVAVYHQDEFISEWENSTIRDVYHRPTSTLEDGNGLLNRDFRYGGAAGVLVDQKIERLLIENVKVDGSGEPTTAGVVMTPRRSDEGVSFKDCAIRDVFTEACSMGVSLIGRSGSVAENITVDGVYGTLRDSGDHDDTVPFVGSFAVDCTLGVTGLKITNVDMDCDGVQRGIHLRPENGVIENVRVQDNTLEGPIDQTAIWFRTRDDGIQKDLWVQNNTVVDADDGIAFSDGTVGCENVHAIDNNVRDCTRGINIADDNVDYAIVKHNILRDNSLGLRDESGPDSIISDNIVDDL